MNFFRVLIWAFVVLILHSCSPTAPTSDSVQTPEDIVVGASVPYYQCVSRDMIAVCDAGLSSTMKSCYYFDASGVKRYYVCTEGWVPYTPPAEPEPVVVVDPTPKASGETNNYIVISNGIRYHCYKSKGYCLENGDITQKKVLLSEVGG